MAAMADVAGGAGVSVATVSHVLNGTRPVLPHTRAPCRTGRLPGPRPRLPRGRRHRLRPGGRRQHRTHGPARHPPRGTRPRGTGFVAGRPGRSTTRERIAGYRHGLAAADLPHDERLLVRGDCESAGAERATAALLSLGARPTALVATDTP